MNDLTACDGPGVGVTSPRTAAIVASVSTAAAALSVERGRYLKVLDLGGGTGGLAVPLAVAGHSVTVVDPSPDALAALRRRASDAGPEAASRVSAVQGDADSLGSLIGPTPPDVICCHATLEHVDDPAATLAHIADSLGSGGLLSLVVPQRAAVVLARALAGQFAQARTALERDDGRWGDADPLPRRFDRAQVLGLVEDVGLAPVQVRGIHIFGDLVPGALLDSAADRAALLELEEAVSLHPEFSGFADLGASLHVIASAP